MKLAREVVNKMKVNNKTALVVYLPMVLLLAMDGEQWRQPGIAISGRGNADGHHNGVILIQSERNPKSAVRLPVNYAGLTPPQVGATFADSAFGTKITRLSNGPSQFNDSVHHEYSSMSPFNKDSTRILLLTDKNGFFVASPDGKVVIEPNELRMGGRAEPRWSATDANVFYFHEDNQIKKYDLTTKRKTVVHTFSQYQKINFGGGEADISDDGDHLIIVGDDRYVGVYQLSRDALGSTLDVGAINSGFDYFDMTPNNNVIVRWNDQGAGRYKGFELYDRNMKFLRQVATFGAHADRGRDLNGDEILVVAAYNDLQPPAGCENNGVEKVRLSDGKRSCLIGLNWDTEIHISVNNAGGHGWALISTIDSKGTANPAASLPAGWERLWKAHGNELLLIRLDGKLERRLAHHRSRKIGEYWFTPRAAISRDGMYALFDSNFGLSPLHNYTDVYLANLGSVTTKDHRN